MIKLFFRTDPVHFHVCSGGCSSWVPIRPETGEHEAPGSIVPCNDATLTSQPFRLLIFPQAFLFSGRVGKREPECKTWTDKTKIVQRVLEDVTGISYVRFCE